MSERDFQKRMRSASCRATLATDRLRAQIEDAAISIRDFGFEMDEAGRQLSSESAMEADRGGAQSADEAAKAAVERASRGRIG